MRISSRFSSSGAADAATESTSTRGSDRTSASRTAVETSATVVALLGEKTRAWTPHPNAGSIGRSRREVPRIRKIDSSIFCSSRDWAIFPLGATWTGNLHPTPRKSLVTVPLPSRQRLLHGTTRGQVDDVVGLEVAGDDDTTAGGRCDLDPPVRMQHDRRARGVVDRDGGSGRVALHQEAADRLESLVLEEHAGLGRRVELLPVPRSDHHEVPLGRPDERQVVAGTGEVG